MAITAEERLLANLEKAMETVRELTDQNARLMRENQQLRFELDAVVN